MNEEWMFARWTRAARFVLGYAAADAVKTPSRDLTPESFVTGLLRLKEGPVPAILAELGLRYEPTPGQPRMTDDLVSSLGVDLDAVRDAVDNAFGPGTLDLAIQKSTWSTPESVRLSEGAAELVAAAARQATELDCEHIGPEHILLALAAAGYVDTPPDVDLRALVLDRLTPEASA